MIAHILPAPHPLSGIIDPPSSKNYTTRFILASCLAKGSSTIRKPAVQEDAVALVRCCRQFGAEITALDARGLEIEFTVANGSKIDRIEVLGFGGQPRKPRDVVDPANAGTVLRLLLGTAALVEGEVRFDTAHHKDSLGKRPNRDLLEALKQLGVEVESRNDDGALPITIRGGLQRIKAFLEKRRKDEGIASFEPVSISVSGAVSSQFLSALLFLAPLIGESLRISVHDELKSVPLIDTTRWVLKQCGIEVHSSADRRIHQIDSGQQFQARPWEVNGDWPGSAAILGAAAVVPGSDIRVRRLHDDFQGERRCIDFYRAMGCEITFEKDPREGEVLRLQSPVDGLRAARINGDLCTDGVLAMMGAAACANGESQFLGIENLQFKECDRVRDPIAELRTIEAASPPRDTKQVAWWEPDTKPDLIHVVGRNEGFEGGIVVDGRKDHRVIMMLSIVGLRCRNGLKIKGAEHVAKSFPRWFDTLRAMGAKVEEA